jgi:hypothetical protein
MALQMEAAPRPVRLAGLPRTAAWAVGDGSGRPLTGPLLGRVPDAQSGSCRRRQVPRRAHYLPASVCRPLAMSACAKGRTYP